MITKAQIAELNSIPGYAEMELPENKSPEEWVAIAEKLAKRNRGKIPGLVWLTKNGYAGLIRCMYVHPKVFAHLKQDRVNRTLKEYIPIAEKLAKQNGGKIPKTTWLQSNGYSGLCRALYGNPAMFAHLEQERTRKTQKEQVAEFEKLAKKNGGKVPTTKWLKAHEYHYLLIALYKHPKLFAHFERERSPHWKTVPKAK